MDRGQNERAETRRALPGKEQLAGRSKRQFHVPRYVGDRQGKPILLASRWQRPPANGKQPQRKASAWQIHVGLFRGDLDVSRRQNGGDGDCSSQNSSKMCRKRDDDALFGKQSRSAAMAWRVMPIGGEKGGFDARDGINKLLQRRHPLDKQQRLPCNAGVPNTRGAGP